MTTTLVRACVIALVVACVSAVETTPPTVTTNVCNMDWYYCPRDPGCVTYDMSVHDVKIHVDGYMEPVKVEDLKPNHTATVQITGITTITEVTPSASYRVYALDGRNMAFGVLEDDFILTGNGGFVFTPSFVITADAIGASGFVEFGIDVFQEKSGTDEGMCVQLASKEYVNYVENRPSPPFQMQCRDLGNGHFIPDVHRIVPKPIVSPSCGAQTCDLEYYYCPRDPGCVTYTMTANSVNVDVGGAAIASGDHISMTVNGTTHIRSVPVAGSYRIYDIAGHNVAAGVLTDVMTLTNCGTLGCSFGITVDFVLPAGAFTPQGWLSWTLDVFQKGSGSDEGMCVQVSNPEFVEYETVHSPPPGFDTYCKSGPYGHFVKDTIPEVIWQASCSLSS